MPEFVIRRRFGLELQFDGEKVTKDYLQGCLAGVEPVIAENDCSVGATNGRWVLKPIAIGWEINSPAFPATTQSLGEARRVLNGIKFIVRNEQGEPIGHFDPITRSCSFHLHLDVSNLCALELLEVLQTAWLIEPAINSTLPPSRLDGSRVHSLRAGFPEKPQDIFCLGAIESKCGVHFCNYMSRGSMEVTYAAGTADSSKVLNWLVFWHSVIERTLQVGPPEAEMTDISAVCDWLLFNRDDPDGDPRDKTAFGQSREFLEDRAFRMREKRRERVLSDL